MEQSAKKSLENLLHVQKELLASAQKKRQALIQNQLEQLAQLTGTESSLISKSRLLEKALAEALNGKTLSEMAIQDEECRVLQTQLTEVVQQLKAENEQNQKLLMDSIAFVQGTLQVMQPKGDATTYTKDAVATGKTKAVFDSKA